MEVFSMTKNLTYSTGMVEGMTGISGPSLYRYVRSFAEFFSPTAAQHVHGRRWTDADVVTAQSIQALFDRRAGADGIRQALRDGYRLDNSPEHNPLVLEAFSQVYEACQLYRDEAKKDREDASNLTHKMAQLVKHTQDDHQLLLNLQTAVQGHSTEITRLATSKKALINIGR
jgi:AcrR family transcriptional regulator